MSRLIYAKFILNVFTLFGLGHNTLNRVVWMVTVLGCSLILSMTEQKTKQKNISNLVCHNPLCN